MNAAYIVLILACFSMEMSWKINTDNILEKLGIGMIAIGSMVHLSGHDNNLVILGSSIYFGTIAIKGVIAKRNRRGSDRIFR